MQINSRKIDFFKNKIEDLWYSEDYQSCLIKIPHLCGSDVLSKKINDYIINRDQNPISKKKILSILINRDFNTIKDYVKFIYKEVKKNNTNFTIISFDENLPAGESFRELIECLVEQNLHLILINDHFHRIWSHGDLAFLGELRSQEMDNYLTCINFCFGDYADLKEHYNKDNLLVTSDYGSNHAIMNADPLSEDEIIEECKDRNIDKNFIDKHIHYIPKIDFLAAKYIKMLTRIGGHDPSLIIEDFFSEDVKNNFNAFMHKIDKSGTLRNSIDFKKLILDKDFEKFSSINYIFIKKNDQLKVESKIINSLLTNYLIEFSDPFENLIDKEESEKLELKSSYNYNLEKKSRDKELLYDIFKTIVAMMNTSGGTLLVGINNKKEIIGININREGFKDQDSLELNIHSRFNDYIGKRYNDLIQINWHDYNNKKILEIKIQHSQEPIYLKDENCKIFFVRDGNNTIYHQNQDDLLYDIVKKFPDHVKAMLV